MAQPAVKKRKAEEMDSDSPDSSDSSDSSEEVLTLVRVNKR